MRVVRIKDCIAALKLIYYVCSISADAMSNTEHVLQLEKAILSDINYIWLKSQVTVE